jgi:hypothetical protein
MNHLPTVASRLPCRIHTIRSQPLVYEPKGQMILKLPIIPFAGTTARGLKRLKRSSIQCS